VNINNFLRQDAWPELNARAVVSLTAYLMPKLSKTVVAELKAHTTDATLCLKLVRWEKTEEEKKQKQFRTRARSATKSTIQKNGSSMELMQKGLLPRSVLADRLARGRSVAVTNGAGCILS
jgi:hypothetical protein